MGRKQKNNTGLKTCETIQDLVASVLNIRDYLTLEEEREIHLQFQSPSWKPDSQVLWSGMLRKEAQKWADPRNMQTLTTAMGPLMAEDNSLCPRKRKSPKAWSKYIHGASAVFAWHIAKGDKVTVLCPPPPQRFHPSGKSFFQTIEKPTLQLAIAKRVTRFVIELVHPAVRGAEDFRYEYWPRDEEERWVSLYGSGLCYKCRWRFVKGDSPSSSKTKNPVQCPSSGLAANKRNVVRAASAAPVIPMLEPKISKKASKKKKKKKKSERKVKKGIEKENRSCCASRVTSPSPNSSSDACQKSNEAKLFDRQEEAKLSKKSKDKPKTKLKNKSCQKLGIPAPAKCSTKNSAKAPESKTNIPRTFSEIKAMYLGVPATSATTDTIRLSRQRNDAQKLACMVLLENHCKNQEELGGVHLSWSLVYSLNCKETKRHRL